MTFPTHPCWLASGLQARCPAQQPSVSPGSGRGYKEVAEVEKPKVKVTSNWVGKEPHTSLQMRDCGPDKGEAGSHTEEGSGPEGARVCVLWARTGMRPCAGTWAHLGSRPDPAARWGSTSSCGPRQAEESCGPGQDSAGWGEGRSGLCLGPGLGPPQAPVPTNKTPRWSSGL